MSIPLPPLPVADPELVKRFGPPTYTLDQLRARDLEVARVVLEAAANIATANREPWTAKAIRALEFHHE